MITSALVCVKSLFFFFIINGTGPMLPCNFIIITSYYYLNTCWSMTEAYQDALVLIPSSI